MHKGWNIRDEPTRELEAILEKKYKEINAAYKMQRKVTKIEDAKKIIDEIWRMKSFVNSIELELLRREYNGTTSQSDEWRER